jgi:hypothetical protein
MWELLTGKLPYSNLPIFEIPNAVIAGARPPIPEKVKQILF